MAPPSSLLGVAHEGVDAVDAGSPHQLHSAFEQVRLNSRDRGYLATCAALRLYKRARNQGRLRRMWAALTGRPRRLFSLKAIEARFPASGRYHAGNRTVPLRDIRGSEGRSRDFDAGFWPIQPHSKERWISVASARLLGVNLPPVKLIQVGSVYFVRDGHHRVSVARALGQTEIDAEVRVWRVAGPLPWEGDTALSASQRPGLEPGRILERGVR